MVKQFEATARNKLRDIRELQEAAWLSEAELQGLREKCTIQKIALDEKIEEVGDYQVRIRILALHCGEVSQYDSP